jgi:hypothetical protein
MKYISVDRRRAVLWEIAALGLAAALPAVVFAQASTDEIPRLADGHPDLSGTWDNGSGIDFVRADTEGASICIGRCPSSEPAAPSASGGPPPAPDRPKYRPEFQARVAELNANQVREDPVLRCFAPGVPRIGPPDKIVQRPEQVIFLYDDVSGNFFRIIPTDGRGHRDDVEASHLGDAIGHWEGDTLVVETVNFNGETWLTDDGSIHTANLRVVERLSRDAETLTWQATAYDSDVLVEPWQMRPRTAYLTDVEVVEAPPCIERSLDNMVDDSSHDNPR